MANESGDMKLLGNFSQLIELVAIDPNYNPANPKLQVTTLNAQKAAGLAAVGDVGTKEAPYKVAVNDRQEAYALLPGIVTRSSNMMKASDASKKILDDAKTVSRKILGRRKSPKVKDDPSTPADEAKSNHSASQMSYENISGNFDDYLAILATVVGYAPNEADLTIAGLTATGNNLKTKNVAVDKAFAPMSATRGERDQLLYLSDDSVVNIALLVKAYVRAAFGPDSQIFKQIKGLPFKRPSK